MARSVNIPGLLPGYEFRETQLPGPFAAGTKVVTANSRRWAFGIVIDVAGRQGISTKQPISTGIGIPIPSLEMQWFHWPTYASLVNQDWYLTTADPTANVTLYEIFANHNPRDRA